MFKFLFFVTFIALSSSTGYAQERVKWDFTYNPTAKEIQIKAQISDGWHLYSQHIANSIGPVPTSFHFEQSTDIIFNGEMTEPTPIRQYDENFEADLDFFTNEVVFTRKVSTVKPGTTIKGYVTFMVCNEVMCLPPTDYNFTIQIPK